MDWEQLKDDIKLGLVFGSAVFVSILALGFGWV